MVDVEGDRGGGSRTGSVDRGNREFEPPAVQPFVSPVPAAVDVPEQPGQVDVASGEAGVVTVSPAGVVVAPFSTSPLSAPLLSSVRSFAVLSSSVLTSVAIACVWAVHA